MPSEGRQRMLLLPASFGRRQEAGIVEAIFHKGNLPRRKAKKEDNFPPTGRHQCICQFYGSYYDYAAFL